VELSNELSREKRGAEGKIKQGAEQRAESREQRAGRSGELRGEQ
jgi:hypothetical protein